MFYLIFSHSQQLLEILAPATLSVYFVYSLFRRKIISLRQNRVLPIFVVSFIYFFSISLINQYDIALSDFPAFIGGDGKIVYSAAFLSVLLLFKYDSQDLKRLNLGVALVAIGIGVFSLVSLFLKPTIGGLPVGAMFLENRTVLIGLLGTKNPFAGSMGQFCVVLLCAIVCSCESKTRRLIFTFALVVALANVGLSGSRGYTLGFICAAVYVIYFSSHQSTGMKSGVKSVLARAGLTIVIALGGILFYVTFTDSVVSAASGGDSNVVNRFALYSYALDLFKKSMLIGVGPGTMTQINVAFHEVIPGFVAFRDSGTPIEGLDWRGGVPIGQHSHNVFIQILVDFGIVGAILYFGSLRKVYRAHQYRRDSAEKKYLRTLFFSLLIYFSVSGLVAGYTFFSPSISMCFYFVIAFMANMRLNSNE